MMLLPSGPHRSTHDNRNNWNCRQTVLERDHVLPPPASLWGGAVNRPCSRHAAAADRRHDLASPAPRQAAAAAARCACVVRRQALSHRTVPDPAEGALEDGVEEMPQRWPRDLRRTPVRKCRCQQTALMKSPLLGQYRGPQRGRQATRTRSACIQRRCGSSATSASVRSAWPRACG